MKIALHGIMLLGLSTILWGIPCPGPAAERPGKPLEWMALLPADEEIPGWKRTDKLLRASNPEDLYRIFNGGATLYIQHGFRGYVGQSYQGLNGTEIEVSIFDQGTRQNAEQLFANPFAKPPRIKEIGNLGETARIDMTPLFCCGVDFIQKGLFVRVVIQDKSEEGLNAAVSFARFISSRIR